MANKKDEAHKRRQLCKKAAWFPDKKHHNMEFYARGFINFILFTTCSVQSYRFIPRQYEVYSPANNTEYNIFMQNKIAIYAEYPVYKITNVSSCCHFVYYLVAFITALRYFVSSIIYHLLFTTLKEKKKKKWLTWLNPRLNVRCEQMYCLTFNWTNWLSRSNQPKICSLNWTFLHPYSNKDLVKPIIFSPQYSSIIYYLFIVAIIISSRNTSHLAIKQRPWRYLRLLDPCGFM